MAKITAAKKPPPALPAFSVQAIHHAGGIDALCAFYAACRRAGDAFYSPDGAPLLLERLEELLEPEYQRLFEMRAAIVNYLETVETADLLEKQAMANVWADWAFHTGERSLKELITKLADIAALPEIKPVM
jgi:hypothetical protein